MCVHVRGVAVTRDRPLAGPGCRTSSQPTAQCRRATCPRTRRPCTRPPRPRGRAPLPPPAALARLGGVARRGARRRAHGAARRGLHHDLRRRHGLDALVDGLHGVGGDFDVLRGNAFNGRRQIVDEAFCAHCAGRVCVGMVRDREQELQCVHACLFPCPVCWFVYA